MDRLSTHCLASDTEGGKREAGRRTQTAAWNNRVPVKSSQQLLLPLSSMLVLLLQTSISLRRRTTTRKTALLYLLRIFILCVGEGERGRTNSTFEFIFGQHLFVYLTVLRASRVQKVTHESQGVDSAEYEIAMP